MAVFTDSITKATIDLATLTDRDLAELQTMAEWEIHRRSVIAESPEKLKSLFEEYEAAGGDRGLLLDRVDPSLRAPDPTSSHPITFYPIERRKFTVLDHDNEEARVRQMPEFGDGPADPKTGNEEA